MAFNNRLDMSDCAVPRVAWRASSYPNWRSKVANCGTRQQLCQRSAVSYSAFEYLFLKDPTNTIKFVLRFCMRLMSCSCRKMPC